MSSCVRRVGWQRQREGSMDELSSVRGGSGVLWGFSCELFGFEFEILSRTRRSSGLLLGQLLLPTPLNPPSTLFTPLPLLQGHPVHPTESRITNSPQPKTDQQQTKRSSPQCLTKRDTPTRSESSPSVATPFLALLPSEQSVAEEEAKLTSSCWAGCSLCLLTGQDGR